MITARLEGWEAKQSEQDKDYRNEQNAKHAANLVKMDELTKAVNMANGAKNMGMWMITTLLVILGVVVAIWKH